MVAGVNRPCRLGRESDRGGAACNWFKGLSGQSFGPKSQDPVPERCHFGDMKGNLARRTEDAEMLRQLVIWLMKTMLDLAIIVSLIAGAIVIAMTAKNLDAGKEWMVIAEIGLGAFGLVALFGLLSLLIEINENLTHLRQTPVRRLEPQI
jgi:hypothetical protein